MFENIIRLRNKMTKPCKPTTENKIHSFHKWQLKCENKMILLPPVLLAKAHSYGK